jgi:Myb/SANT-like DNA-binding domain
MDIANERKRKPKFTREENEALVANYAKHAVELTKKFGSGITNAKKIKIWQAITNAVNAVGVTVRTVQDVTSRWKEQKKTSKEKGNWPKIPPNIFSCENK